MADLIRVDRSGSPWEPTEGATLTDEFDRWDVPTLGIIEQSGASHIFSCLAGNPDTYSLWAYAHISESEVNRLRVSEGKDFEEAVQAATSNRYLRVVLFDGVRHVLIHGATESETAAGLDDSDTHGMLLAMLEDLTKELREDLDALSKGIEQIAAAAS